MAQLFHPTYTKPIPEGAKIVVKRTGADKGRRFVERKDKRGRHVQHAVTEDGTKMLVPAQCWYIRYYLPDGLRKTVKGYADRKATEALALELERRAEREDAGILDPTDKHARVPLATHAEDYRRFLASKGNTPEYVAKTLSRLTVVLDGCLFVRTCDLQPSRVLEFIAELRRDVVRAEKVIPGKGLKTANEYLASVKGFTRWMWKDRRLHIDPLAGVSRLGNAETDIRHARRDFTTVELLRLLQAAKTSRTSLRGLSGPDRYYLYLTAAATGFRASELASMTPDSFDIAARTATVEASCTKNRREAVQPLPLDVVDELARLLDGKPTGAPVWPGKWRTKAFIMMQADLAAARAAWLAEAPNDRQRQDRQQSDFLAYRDADGRFLDFHSLRHTFVTAVGRTGASPKVHQELARHSTYALTGRYTHARIHDLAATVDSMPSIVPPEPKPLQATGTDCA